ncbi:MAG: hypothetical protein WD314_05280 [Trueperaceae bacterium]
MVVVGMFDDAQALEQGLARLTDAGLDRHVQRLEGPPGPGTPGAAGASEGGDEPLDLPHSKGVVAPWPTHLSSAESPMIGGNVLDSEERDYYRRLLEDGGRILVVEVDEGRGDEAERLLDGAGASRVARHVR